MSSQIRHLITEVEIAAGQPLRLQTEQGTFHITIEPVQNKFRTYTVAIEIEPVTLESVKHLNRARRN